MTTSRRRSRVRDLACSRSPRLSNIEPTPKPFNWPPGLRAAEVPKNDSHYLSDKLSGKSIPYSRGDGALRVKFARTGRRAREHVQALGAWGAGGEERLARLHLRAGDRERDRRGRCGWRRDVSRVFYDNATNPANLCPIYCGGAATYSRPRTIILHNEDGDCKSFLRLGRPPAREPARCGLRGLPGKTESNEKKNECVFIDSVCCCGFRSMGFTYAL